MAKNTAAKVMAFIALFGIVAGIAGTGILFFFSQPQEQENEVLTQEALQDLIRKGTSSGAITDDGSTTITVGEDNTENNSGTIILDSSGDITE